MSVSQDIEDAVVQYILLAEIDGIDEDGKNILRREYPERLDKDPSPCCIVNVGNERPVHKPREQKTNSTWLFEYPVLVLLVKKTSMTQPKSDPWKKDAREKIRDMLNMAFLLGENGVVRRCVYNPQPRFQATGFTHDFKVSAQEFLYRTEENRAA